MSTFSLPNTSKTYQPKASKANYIQPGKRSVSTACPTIIVDKNGSVRLVVGGSGGLRITPGVVTVRNLPVTILRTLACRLYKHDLTNANVICFNFTHKPCNFTLNAFQDFALTYFKLNKNGCNYLLFKITKS